MLKNSEYELLAIKVLKYSNYLFCILVDHVEILLLNKSWILLQIDEYHRGKQTTISFALHMIHISGKKDAGNVDCSCKRLMVSDFS